MNLKHLFVYFALAYFISWILWLPMYSYIWGLNLPILPFQHALGGMGPLIASFVTTAIYYKQKGVKQLLKSCFQVKPVLYFLIALLIPFLLAAIAALMANLINNTTLNLSAILVSKEFPDFGLPLFFIYNIVFFGFGEEAGWRGFALPQLQKKFNAFTSAIILTLLWAAWHWPLFFYRPGYTAMDVAGVIGWVLSLLTGSILLTWLYNSSKGSILICAVFHATVDIAFTADFVDKNIVNYMGFLITVWGVLTVVIFKPKYLAGNVTDLDK